MNIFYTAKTHKSDMPFRAIVSERGTWLQAISGYLQKTAGESYYKGIVSHIKFNDSSELSRGPA